MKAKVTLSGATLKAMTWDTRTLSAEFGPLAFIWEAAEQKRRGRGFYRSAHLSEEGVEATMNALETKLDSLKEGTPMFNAIYKDSEQLRLVLTLFEENNDC